MKRYTSTRGIALAAMVLLLAASACKKEESDPKAGAPPQAKVTTAFEAEEFSVDRPDQYPLTAAVEHRASASPNSDCILSAVPPRLEITHHPATSKRACADLLEDRRSP